MKNSLHHYSGLNRAAFSTRDVEHVGGDAVARTSPDLAMCRQFQALSDLAGNVLNQLAKGLDRHIGSSIER
jgi:hypothetical protein